MKLVLNSTEMKAIDEYTIVTQGIPQEVLMERAANEVVTAMKQHIKKEDHILVVCGSGNNGGDGVAAGRILYLQGYHVALLFIGEEQKASIGFQRQLQIAKNLGIPMEHSNKLCEYNIIIDAIFGVGLSRDVTGIYQEIIEQINALKATVFAVDIPSGICADDGRVMNFAVRANYTITFGYFKIGLLLYPGADYAGEINVVDIGFAPISEVNIKANTVCFDQKDLSFLPVRSNYGNKGTFGKVLVIAGSKGMSGAAFFSAKAAYRTGAGMVKILTTEDNRVILQSILPEALFEAYDDSTKDEEKCKESICENLKWADVVIFGPGIGRSQMAAKLLKIVLDNRTTPLILDADGINLLAEELDAVMKSKVYGTEQGIEQGIEQGTEEQETEQETELETQESSSINYRHELLRSKLNGQIILTPHLMELSRLLGCSISGIVNNLVDTAFQCSYNNNLIYAIKDARTIVTQADQCYINISGNNGMATAGSGDVLTGIIAALIAQGMTHYEATCLAVYLHGLAGDEAAKRKGKYSLMAGDIVDHIETVLLNASRKA